MRGCEIDIYLSVYLHHFISLHVDSLAAYRTELMALERMSRNALATLFYNIAAVRPLDGKYGMLSPLLAIVHGFRPMLCCYNGVHVIHYAVCISPGCKKKERKKERKIQRLPLLLSSIAQHSSRTREGMLLLWKMFQRSSNLAPPGLGFWLLDVRYASLGDSVEYGFFGLSARDWVVFHRLFAIELLPSCDFHVIVVIGVLVLGASLPRINDVDVVGRFVFLARFTFIALLASRMLLGIRALYCNPDIVFGSL